MKTHTAYFTFHARQHREYLNITDRVAAEVQASGIREGMVLVSAMHIWRQLGDALSPSGRPLPESEARPPSDQRERPQQKVASHTAGVWVNGAESGLLADIDQWLEQLAPFRAGYQHHRTGESNGDSHLKSLLVHHEVIVPITAGQLDYGWRGSLPAYGGRPAYAHASLGAPEPQAGAALRRGRAEPAPRQRAAQRNFAAFRADFAGGQSGATPAIGPWQQIYSAEFDGQRAKRVVVKAMGA